VINGSFVATINSGGEQLFDSELAFPVAFLLLGAAGLVYAVLATYFYFRFERSAADMHVPVALSAFLMFYVLTFGSRLYVRGEALLPFLLLFGCLRFWHL
jgi:membrane associated rhomboid family serine protease